MTKISQPNRRVDDTFDGAWQESHVSSRRTLLIASCLVLIVAAGFANHLQFVRVGSDSVGSSQISVTPSTTALPTPTIDAGGIEFAEVARERGLLHVWPRQPRPMTLREMFGCGCAAFDYDNDGLQDVLLVADPYPVLYHNTGGGNFQNVTAELGFARVPGSRRARRPDSADWTGVAIGDYDGDGWLDVLLTGFHRLALYKNDGGNTLVDVTARAGLDPRNQGHWGSSAGFMDLDGDSLLDLVILNYVDFGRGSKQYCELVPGVTSGCPPNFYQPERSEIWRNTGRGRFESVPASAGMQDTSGVAMVLAFTDLDGDNRQDFFIGNDRTRSEFLQNQGGMEFNNTALEIGLTVGQGWIPMAAMGADWADFNRDGLLDLTVTDYQGNSFALFKHESQESDDGARWHHFVEVGNQTGIAPATRNRLGFGAKWLDIDNDGWPDLCCANGHVYDNAGDIEAGHTLRQPSLFLRNIEGRHFINIMPVLDPALAKPIVGRGSATADFNNDGRVDVLIVDYEGAPLFLENHSQRENHWIKFDLRGADHNTFAYGARVTSKSSKDVWIGEVSPASSYLSSSDPRIHFGLGTLTALETVTIRWPSGRVEELHDVPADRIVRVVEGQGIVTMR